MHVNIVFVSMHYNVEIQESEIKVTWAIYGMSFSGSGRMFFPDYITPKHVLHIEYHILTLIAS